jgi:hypothetical protein
MYQIRKESFKAITEVEGYLSCLEKPRKLYKKIKKREREIKLQFASQKSTFVNFQNFHNIYLIIYIYMATKPNPYNQIPSTRI